MSIVTIHHRKSRALTIGVASATVLLASGAATLSASHNRLATQVNFGRSAPVGITLDKSREIVSSAIRVGLTRDFATLSLHKGTVDGKTVWYVITDVSDAGMARRLGVNHAPKLRNAPRDCPACVQEVRTANPILGKAPV